MLAEGDEPGPLCLAAPEELRGLVSKLREALAVASAEWHGQVRGGWHPETPGGEAAVRTWQVAALARRWQWRARRQAQLGFEGWVDGRRVMGEEKEESGGLRRVRWERLEEVSKAVFGRSVRWIAATRRLHSDAGDCGGRSIADLSHAAFRRFHWLSGYGGLSVVRKRPQRTDMGAAIERWRRRGSCSGKERAAVGHQVILDLFTDRCHDSGRKRSRVTAQTTAAIRNGERVGRDGRWSVETILEVQRVNGVIKALVRWKGTDEDGLPHDDEMVTWRGMNQVMKEAVMVMINDKYADEDERRKRRKEEQQVRAAKRAAEPEPEHGRRRSPRVAALTDEIVITTAAAEDARGGPGDSPTNSSQVGPHGGPSSSNAANGQAEVAESDAGVEEEMEIVEEEGDEVEEIGEVVKQSGRWMVWVLWVERLAGGGRWWTKEFIGVNLGGTWRAAAEQKKRELLARERVAKRARGGGDRVVSLEERREVRRRRAAEERAVEAERARDQAARAAAVAREREERRRGRAASAESAGIL